MRCIMLHGGATKALHQLQRRLEPLGWKVRRAWNVPSYYVLIFSRKLGCILVTTDKWLRKHGACYIDMEYAAEKGKRDLAQHIIAVCLDKKRRKKRR